MESGQLDRVKGLFLNVRKAGFFSTVNITSFIYLIILSGTIYDNYALIPSWILQIHCVAIAIILCNMYLFSRLKSIPVSASILIFCIFAVHMVNVQFAGGVSTPHYAWIVMVPILAGATVGWRGQTVFLGLTILGTIYYYLFPVEITQMPYDEAAPYILGMRLLSLIICSLVMISYHVVLSDKIFALNAALTRASFESDLFFGVFNNNIQSALLLDKSGTVIRANALAQKLFASSNGNLIGKNFSEICALSASECADVATHVRNGHMEQTFTLKTGEIVCLDSTMVTVDNIDGEHFTLILLEDVSPRKHQERQLYEIAHYDTLTGLPNRLLMQDRLAKLVDDAVTQDDNRFSVLFVDLDGFKAINDSEGHDVGDLVLSEVATRLRASQRSSDMAARFGGDEFVILLEGICEHAEIEEAFLLIQSCLSEPIEIHGSRYFLSASVGVARYPFDALTTAELLRKADAAMFNAKKAGGNAYVFYDQLEDKSLKRSLKIKTELNYALERDEFELAFQPIVNKSEDIVGAEALLRWNHKTLGSVSPDEFIPICEESNLIVGLGYWILNQASAALRQYHRKGFEGFFITVNVSYRQICMEDFVAHVEAILKAHDLDGKHLMFELTERVFVEDIKLVQQSIEQLNGLGITVAIDDFGTDYSSLSYLKDTSFSAIKIDKAFVKSIAHSASAATLCRAMTSMAHSLGLKVIAEGVETSAQFNILRNYNVDRYQGYLFAKPQSHFELEKSLEAESERDDLLESIAI